MCLSQIIQDLWEDSGLGEEVPLPSVRAKMLGKVIAYCEHHEGRAAQELRMPLTDADLRLCGASSFDCELVRLPCEELFELIAVAKYLDIEPLLHLSLAKAASMLMGPTVTRQNPLGTTASAAALFARARQRLGKPPCGWSVRCWHAERSEYAEEGGMELHVHDETGWWQEERPADAALRGEGWSGHRWLWLAAGTWSEDAVFKLCRRQTVLRHALSQLLASSQQWEGALTLAGDPLEPRASRLLVEIAGGCFDPGLYDKIARLPESLQCQIGSLVGSEVMTILSDTVAVVRCLGLDALAAELGELQDRALESWRAKLARGLRLMPQMLAVANIWKDPNAVRGLDLHPDGTFIYREYLHAWRVDSLNRELRHERKVCMEQGTWTVHSRSCPLTQEPSVGYPFEEHLFEGAVLLEGTRRTLEETDDLTLVMSTDEAPVKRLIGYCELLEWMRRGQTLRCDQFRDTVQRFIGRFVLAIGDVAFVKRHYTALCRFFCEQPKAELGKVAGQPSDPTHMDVVSQRSGRCPQDIEKHDLEQSSPDALPELIAPEGAERAEQGSEDRAIEAILKIFRNLSTS